MGRANAVVGGIGSGNGTHVSDTTAAQLANLPSYDAQAQAAKGGESLRPLESVSVNFINITSQTKQPA